jgi:hypothetical protein
MVLVGKEGRVECGIRGRLRVGKRGKGLRMGKGEEKGKGGYGWEMGRVEGS